MEFHHHQRRTYSCQSCGWLRISQHGKATFEVGGCHRCKLLLVPLVGGSNVCHLQLVHHVVFVHGIERKRTEIWHNLLLAGLCYYGQLRRHIGQLGSVELHHHRCSHHHRAKRWNRSHQQHIPQYPMDRNCGCHQVPLSMRYQHVVQFTLVEKLYNRI